MLVFLMRLSETTDKHSTVFIYLYFDVLNDGLHLYAFWSYLGHSVCPPSLGPKGKYLSVSLCSFIPRLHRCTKLPRHGQDEGGFDRDEQGFHFWFILYVTDIIMLLKKFFQHTWQLCLNSYAVPCCALCPG